MHIHKENLDVSGMSEQEENFQGKYKILFIFHKRIKERKLQTLRSLENNLFKKHSIQGKGQKKIL